ncbi:hypothetical protein VOLCADRAFT_95428 [Volvox carteri f. nagariensis]|uniref:Uncharacterized protein n=1 Tax=Volvox carteri f. nagariensis TaxID=3068 RepID=D8U7F3_VOLCA|nr:uncharacterized protein VOLCADRAFT_95428 [Volvox carteri f. nagariensis]EFJ44290.1 hypothetical protein VOLCADRAFT_95428 [Volvox carteri f. nagariensis]|eukprot:XP_002954649.1 hypothetical protein VOLCADRAFT_95428 [Volvox carteri f. nagariensis]
MMLLLILTTKLLGFGGDWLPKLNISRPSGNPATELPSRDHLRTDVEYNEYNEDDSWDQLLESYGEIGESVPQQHVATPAKQQSSGSSGSAHQHHLNGLPVRHPSGPLPGMPFLSELVSRYPVRQAPATGPQISLVSGQLYISNRLREAMSVRKATSATTTTTTPEATSYSVTSSAPVAATAAANAAGGGGGFPTRDMFVPTYADLPFSPGGYMQQRRAEREQRALCTAGQHQHQHQQRNKLQQQQQQQQRSTSSRPTTGLVPDSAIQPRLAKSPPTGRSPSATIASGRNGGGGGCTAGSARQREVREGVERWLEASESSGFDPEDANGSGGGGDGRVLTRHDLSGDPSLIYRKYGIFRTYGKQSQVLWPSMSMPVTASRSGLRVAFERKRTSSGTSGGVGGASPKRPSSQPVPWAPLRQSAW